MNLYILLFFFPRLKIIIFYSHAYIYFLYQTSYYFHLFLCQYTGNFVFLGLTTFIVMGVELLSLIFFSNDFFCVITLNMFIQIRNISIINSVIPLLRSYYFPQCFPFKCPWTLYSHRLNLSKVVRQAFRLACQQHWSCCILVNSCFCVHSRTFIIPHKSILILLE